MRVIGPGSTIGVLGSGQLGRMLAMAARRLGYRVHVFSPEADTPAGQIADVEVAAPYHDLDAVRKFAAGVDVLTFEFENVPADTAQAAAEQTLVRPNPQVLHTTQHRLREKTALSRGGFPVTPFHAIENAHELQEVMGRLGGGTAVLKTAGWGYDGKGQVKLNGAADSTTAWTQLGSVSAILEEWVDYQMEASVVAARGADGSVACYPVFQNEHRNHILDVTCCPAQIPKHLADEAQQMARAILEHLDVVGVMCVEFFITRSGKLLVNELAPRPHNSGHLTIEACPSSQFEQQLRAVCGLPLGGTDLRQPAAMANLLGDIWSAGEPDWPAALAEPNTYLHLYGKAKPALGRKMGHIVALDDDVQRARERALTARHRLCPAAGRAQV